MFSNPTVIIVGAGASAEFGLPTGEGMHRSVVNETFETIQQGDTQADFFLASFWKFLMYENLHGQQTTYRQFVEVAKQSPSTSIDLFAYNNPSHEEVAKLYSAWSIAKSQFDFELKQDHDFQREYYAKISRSPKWLSPQIGEDHRLNWLAELVNQFVEGAQSSKDLEENKLTFVTFNYDSIVEEAFVTFVRRLERFADAPDNAMPEVIHIHGRMDSPDVPNLNKNWILDQAKNIRFITETIVNPGSAVDRAIALLDEALHVYSVGFAFEPNNTKLLAAGKWGGKVVGLNYAGNAKIENRIKRLGVKRNSIWRGSGTAPLKLGLAAADGFFEAIPSD